MKGSDLRDGIVRVLSRDRQSVLGTGFLVSDTLVVTCSHVLDSLTDGERGAIALEVLQTHEKVTAKLRPESSSPESVADFAVLELNRPLRGAFRPLPLGEAARSADHRFTAFGFPKGNEDTGTWAHGTIGYATGEGAFRKLLLLESNIREGFSGGPLFDEQTRRVVGVVRFRMDGQGLREAYASPVELLVEQCPELRTSEDCPYRDLASFRESDARFWKGRERVLHEQLLPLLKKLPRFVEVSGPSGCGKSSLLYAGLVPALKEGTFIPGSARWDVRTFRPGLEPFAALDKAGLPASADGGQDLASRLRRWRSEHPEAEQRLVLVIDQLEDLLLRGGGAEEEHRQRFLQQLAGLKDEALPVTCVVALREGFDALLSQRAPALRSLLGEHRVQVPAVLTPAELRDIIAGPAREVGLRFEPPEVVETIVQAAQQEFPVETGAGARATVLPLLEVTMTQLWQASRDGAVTLEAFNASTGLLGMLARWADGVYETLGPAERKLADRLLLELIQFGVADDLLEDKGRRVPIETLRERLGGQAEVDAVLQVLVNGRLLVTSRDGQRQQDTVELIHDALLTHWKHFADLRSRDRVFRRWYTEVQADAERWDAVARASGSTAAEERLLRGSELATARDMLAAHPGEVSALATRFITCGEEAERTRRQADEERTRREQVLASRANQYLGIVVGLVVLSLLLNMADSLWWSHRPGDGAVDAGSAEQEAREREELRRDRIAAADEVVRLAGGPGREVESLVRAIALAGARLPGVDPAADETVGALHQAISAFRYSVPLSMGGEPPVSSARAPGESAPASPEEESAVVAAFSPSERYIVTRGLLAGSRRLVTRVWGAMDGAMLAELDSRELCPSGCGESALLAAGEWARTTHAFSFSPRDASLWLGMADGRLVRWHDQLLHEPIERPHTAEITAVSFNASGDRVLTASLDGTAQLWDVKTLKPLGPRLKLQAACEQAVLSPDGRHALVAGLNRTCLFETATGRCQPFESGGTGPTLGFSSSGRLAVLGDSRVNGRLLVWNIRSNREHRLLGDVGGHIFMPFFSEDDCSVTGFDREATSAQQHELCKPAVRGRFWKEFTTETVVFSDGRRLQQLDPVESLNLDSPFFSTPRRPSPPLFLLRARLHGKVPVQLSSGAGGSFLLAATASGLERRTRHIDRWVESQHEKLDLSPDARWSVWLKPDQSPSTWLLSLYDRERYSSRMVYLEGCNAGSRDELTTAFSSDGRLAVACGDKLWLWNLPSSPAESLLLRDAPVMMASRSARKQPWAGLTFSPDGRSLLTTSQEDGAVLWSAADGRPRRELGLVHEATFSPDGRLLLVLGADGVASPRTVRIHDSETGEELCRTPDLSGTLGGMQVSFKGERFLISRHEEPSFLGSTRDCQRVRELPRLTDDAVVRFSPDGGRLVTLSRDVTGSGLWDGVTGDRLMELPPAALSPGDIAFSPDSRLLLLLSEKDGGLVAFDTVRGGRAQMNLPGLQAGSVVETFAFTPDGSRFVLVAGGSIRLFEFPGWRQVESIALAGGSRHRLWFAGDYFGLTGNELPSLQLWSARDGRRITTLHGAMTWGEVRSSPKGDRIVTFDAEETRFFSLRRNELLRDACALMANRPEYSRVREYCASSTDLKSAETPTP
ncbi:trypsin-like serine protease [Pyxidicoccus fallax]|uniref:Trypsin-like serine protease n=1 Tax=Pyxidicoccus fallax TaxID=394095 RepID=A0A848LTZ8_9BACT|nr:trypsin-like peptidase domain-containing protein [Pyxidicoccus fallax]NMO21141.1 trypsin-like serine protease [Pyxidicoccus fallax]NPC84325.1 trypsin-like serine protease [Pyxidicoccus fallax]